MNKKELAKYYGELYIMLKELFSSLEHLVDVVEDKRAKGMDVKRMEVECDLLYSTYINARSIVNREVRELGIQSLVEAYGD